MRHWLLLSNAAVAVVLSASVRAGDLEDGLAAYRNQDYRTAMRFLRPLADKGKSNAQYDVGLMYANGQGVSQNFAIAATWYRKAADQGDGDAMTNLGFMYEHGQGVQQDYEEAIQWYQKAAEQGNAVAQFNLGASYANGLGGQRDYSAAVKWYRKAASQGNSAAQASLAGMYEDGHAAFISGDYRAAIGILRPLADDGNSNSQYLLGLMYEHGFGLPQDYAEALRWYHLAAEMGNVNAQAKLTAISQPTRVPPVQSREQSGTTSGGYNAADNSNSPTNYSGCVFGAIQAYVGPNPNRYLIRQAYGLINGMKELCRLKYPCNSNEVPSNDYDNCVERR